MRRATPWASSAIHPHRARSSCSATSTPFPATFPCAIEQTTLLYGRGSVDAKGPLATFVGRRGALRVGGGARPANSASSLSARSKKKRRPARARGSSRRASTAAAIRFPTACIIGEPSHWNRVTLGYKGRLLLDFTADQPMAHTAGPDASVASVVVDYWNWVTAHAARVNEGKDKVFDQLSPSLRRFITSTNDQMHDTVDAQFAWRLPVGFDADAFMKELERQASGQRLSAGHDQLRSEVPRLREGLARRSQQRAGQKLSRGPALGRGRRRNSASSSRPAPAT